MIDRNAAPQGVILEKFGAARRMCLGCSFVEGVCVVSA